MEYLWIAVGGLVGCNARFVVGRAVISRIGEAASGTFLVNITGAFLIGLIATVVAERAVGSSVARPLLIIGFLGGYTTFSSYTLEAVTWLDQGEFGHALLYAVGMNLIGLIACYLGIVAARAFV